MEGSNRKTDFTYKKTSFSTTELVVPCDINDPEKNYFNDQLQEIDSPNISLKILKCFQSN